MAEVELGTTGLGVTAAAYDTSLRMWRHRLDCPSRDTMAMAGCSQVLEPLHSVDGQIRDGGCGKWMEETPGALGSLWASPHTKILPCAPSLMHLVTPPLARNDQGGGGAFK